MRRFRKVGDVVRVDWLDAQGGSISGWESLEEIKRKKKPAIAVSFGVVVAHSDNAIIICPHWHGDEHKVSIHDAPNGDGTIVIPGLWIKNVKLLDVMK